MTEQRLSAVRIEIAGEHYSVGKANPPAEVARIIRNLGGERGAIVHVQPEGLEERLLIAVDDRQVFLGLERPDGLMQFSRPDQGSTPRRLTIGGRDTHIESRYVLDIDTAQAVVQEWLTSGEWSSTGQWERP